MSRLRVLVSAYACHPLATEESFPGEAILGWNIVRQLCRFHDVTVLTRSYNRDALERGLKERGLEADCRYVTLPRALSPLLKHYLGFSLYYLFWQMKAYGLARRLVRESRFDVFHQVTFANDWMPSFIGAYIRIPFIWGPLGGAHRTPPSLLPELGTRFRRKELDPGMPQGPLAGDALPPARPEAGRGRPRLQPRDRGRARRRRPQAEVLPGERHQRRGAARGAGDGRGAGGQPDSRFRVLFAGRLDPIKGLKLGVRAFAKFSSSDPRAAFEIIGSGEAEAEVRALIRSLGLEDRIR